MSDDKKSLDELAKIENSLLQNWVNSVRELLGHRDPASEATYLPEINVQLETFHSNLAGDVTVMVMTPAKTNNRALVYLHGGGWISPLNSDHIKWAKYMAALTNYTVYAVEYKLCPEYPFPAGLYDAVATYQLAIERGFEKIAVGGDSSGGNLAVALALYARDNQLPMPQCILDNCSIHDFYFEKYTSAQTIGLEPGACIDMRLVGFNRGCYVPLLKDWKHPYASPIYADLTDLPPTFVLVAGDDPLKDDNMAFAKEAQKVTSNKVILKVYDHLPHSFHCHMDDVPEAAKLANDDLAAFLLDATN